MPSLTIIIPTFNRPVQVQATIDQLRSQGFRDFELWIIDQSDPAAVQSTRDYVASAGDDRLHHLPSDVRNLPNARNEGLVRARGEIVLFVDDDVILLSDHFIEAHVRAYDDPAVGGVTGRHVERFMKQNSRVTACHVSLGGRTIFNLFGRDRQEIGSCKGSNMSFRMAAILQVGGFDRRTHLLEDTDFSVRIAKAGWRLLFEPEADLVHLSSVSGGVREQAGLTTECRRFQSTAYYIRKHRGPLGVACFLATFGLIGAMRTVRYRTLTAPSKLAAAISAGFAQARQGPDQALHWPGPAAG